jgi:Cytochrome c554 and c-prime/Doubled CXXCH motif (Paired_CXXCH_1)
MAKQDPRVCQRSMPRRIWKAGLFLGCVCLVIGAVTWRKNLPVPLSSSAWLWSWNRARRDTYVGSQSCAACHPGEFALHSRSRHARTLHSVAGTPWAGRLNGLTIIDPERPEVRWSYGLRGSQLWIERRESADLEQLPIDYAFGSGRHGVTLVTLSDRTPNHPEIIEHRLSVVARGESFEITPGQEAGTTREGIVPFGRHHQSALTLKCFHCHTTTTSDRGPLVLDEATMIADVGCESCHGPGRTHVEAAKRGSAAEFLAMPFGLDRGNIDDEIRMCGACHRLPANVELERIAADDPSLVRFPPVGLLQSACYRMSPGALSCSSCHDPHARTSTDLAGYEAVCLSCHRARSPTSCNVSPATGCIPCHMPRRDVSHGVLMTDHWIRTRRG